MMRFWRKRRRPARTARPGPEAHFAPPAPERPLYVIGDVHGCLGHLEALVALIEADALERGVIDDCVVVLTGDIVDRGDESRDVLERLLSLSSDAGDSLVCLQGNHERMMLDFMARPESGARAWLRHGGLQTLASFGVRGVGPSSGGERAVTAANDLFEAIPDAMMRWIREMPASYRSGNVAVVHAGADPMQSLEMQETRHLVWGHPDFERVSRVDGLWIVHGHTVVPEPVMVPGRIAVDTGAWESGRLTAAAIWDGEVRFLTT